MNQPARIDSIRAKFRQLMAGKVRAESERATAIQHLFNILDGADRESAILEAREWLGRKYGADYAERSRVAVITAKALRRFRETDEFPEELETAAQSDAA